MPFIQPIGDALGFELLIVLAGTNLHLRALGLGDVGLGFGLAGFAFGLVAILTKVSDLGDRRIGLGGDLDQVKLALFSFFEGICEGEGAEIFAFRTNDAQFARTNRLIDPESGVFT